MSHFDITSENSESVNAKEKNMIEYLVAEINACLCADLQFAALALALTLPDSCGKIYCPNAKTRERYVQWFDDHIAKQKKTLFNAIDNDFVGISGEMVYQLRCAMLHESDPTIPKKIENTTRFSLILRPISSCSRTTVERCIQLDLDGKPFQQEICVDIVSLCKGICEAAQKYYQKNKDRFSFDYRIVSAPDGLASAFDFSNELEI